MTLDDIKRRQNWATGRVENWESEMRLKVARWRQRDDKTHHIWTFPFDWINKRNRVWDSLHRGHMAIRLRLL